MLTPTSLVLTDLVVILVLGSVCFIPFTPFVRGFGGHSVHCALPDRVCASRTTVELINLRRP